MKRLAASAILTATTYVLLCGQQPNAPHQFFPMTVGTYWVYEGTVSWPNPETEEPVNQAVSWKMSVLKVARKKGLVGIIVLGFPADLDWSTGKTEPQPWLILEDEKRQVYRANLGPNYDLTRLDGPDPPLERFLDQDALLFEWPLRKGAKFCDEEAKPREDDLYCWVVTEEAVRPVSVKGIASAQLPVFRLQYRSLPDGTSMDLVPGVGVISYQYHHHGTVADTDLKLVEFHPAPGVSEVQGTNP
jgi:hypothetical protein